MPTAHALHASDFGAHHVFDGAKPVDFNAHRSPARSQRAGLKPPPMPPGGTGENHIARLQGHDPGEVLDLLIAVEDQLTGVRVLPRLIIDEAFSAELVRIVDVIGGDNPRAEWRVGIERLAQGDLRRTQLQSRTLTSLPTQ